MEIIFDRKAFLGYKEKINKEKYISKGVTEKLDNVQKDYSIKESLPVDKIGEENITKGEKGELKFPKANTDEMFHSASRGEDKVKEYVSAMVDKLVKEGYSKEQAMEKALSEVKARGYDIPEKKAAKLTDEAQEFISNKIKLLIEEGYDQEQAAAIAYSQAREKGYDVPEKKEAGVKMAKIDNIQEGEKGKLDFPTSQDKHDPSVKQPYLKTDKPTISKGPEEKINIEKSQASFPSAELKVSTESGNEFKEEGDKGAFKKINPEPGVSADKLKDADKPFSDYEQVPKMMKQFNIKFYKKQDPYMYKEAMVGAIDSSIKNMETIALALGKNIFDTPIAPIYAGLILARDVNTLIVTAADSKKTIFTLLKELKDKYMTEKGFDKEKFKGEFKGALKGLTDKFADWMEQYDFKEESGSKKEPGEKGESKGPFGAGDEKKEKGGFPFGKGKEKGEFPFGKEKGSEEEPEDKNILEKISRFLFS